MNVKYILRQPWILYPLAIILFVIVGYVLLNTGYFWKQFNYSWQKSIYNQEIVKQNKEKADPNVIVIPTLGIKAPIVEAKENNERSFQEALGNGVVHFPGTAKVGEVGNAYLFGHSSDFAFKAGNYKSVFALLPKIQTGTEISVSDGEGNQFIYVVSETKVVSPADTSVLEQNTNGAKILTLQTSYPVGTALKRFIVISKLRE